MESPKREFKTSVKHGSKVYIPSYCTTHGTLNMQVVTKKYTRRKYSINKTKQKTIKTINVNWTTQNTAESNKFRKFHGYHHIRLACIFIMGNFKYSNLGSPVCFVVHVLFPTCIRQPLPLVKTELGYLMNIKVCSRQLCFLFLNILFNDTVITHHCTASWRCKPRPVESM